MTAHFAFRTVHYPTAKQWREAEDDFAELLSTDRYSLNEIASIMGISRGSACVLLGRVCAAVGEAVA